MPARVLFVALDAAESTLLPGPLVPDSAMARLGNRMDTLPGAIWPEIVASRSAGRAPLYFHPWQLRTGESVPRAITTDMVDAECQFPVVAARAGCRVLSMDLPQSAPARGIPGAHIFEWGTHDRWIGPASEPPELVEAIRRAYGDHPIDSCDGLRGGTATDYERFLRSLLEGIERRTRIVCGLLDRESWDLAAVAFSESHCAGHQLWCFADERHPLHGTDVPERLHGALAEVYAALVAAVGRVVAAAGPDCAVVAVTSHGMGPYIGGYQLLPEVLARLDLGLSPSSWARRHQRMGRRARRVARVVLPSRSLRQRLVHRAESSFARLDRPGVRAVALANNRAGAIRLNLAGREPTGTVAPGAEAEQLLARLRRELGALLDPVSGEPIVDAVRTAAEAFGPDHHPDVPDLLVTFRTDLGPLEECTSPTVGTVRVPFFDPLAGGGTEAWPHRTRSGDHTDVSTMWLRAPGLGPERTIDGADVLDLAPTVLSLLGVAVPPWMEGRPLV